jgi:hypothetical protein
MARRSTDHLNFVTEELTSRGIRFETSSTGKSHIKIHWQVADKRPRYFVVPNSPSDHRGRLNARSAVRRMLREDCA